MTTIMNDVLAELERAMRKFPTWPTDPLHALAVLGEEFGELTKDVLQLTYEPHKTTPQNVRKEAIQTAAMALRFAASLEVYDYSPGFQHEQDARAFGVPERVGPEGWKRLAESLRALGETDDRIKELAQRYGLDADDVPEVDPTEKLRRALGDIISQTVVIERIGSEDWQDWQKKNQRVRQIASAALAPGVAVVEQPRKENEG